MLGAALPGQRLRQRREGQRRRLAPAPRRARTLPGAVAAAAARPGPARPCRRLRCTRRRSSTSCHHSASARGSLDRVAVPVAHAQPGDAALLPVARPQAVLALPLAGACRRRIQAARGHRQRARRWSCRPAAAPARSRMLRDQTAGVARVRAQHQQRRALRPRAPAAPRARPSPARSNQAASTISRSGAFISARARLAAAQVLCPARPASRSRHCWRPAGRPACAGRRTARRSGRAPAAATARVTVHRHRALRRPACRSHPAGAPSAPGARPAAAATARTSVALALALRPAPAPFSASSCSRPGPCQERCTLKREHAAQRQRAREIQADRRRGRRGPGQRPRRQVVPLRPRAGRRRPACRLRTPSSEAGARSPIERQRGARLARQREAADGAGQRDAGHQRPARRRSSAGARA